MPEIGLPWELYNWQQLEWYGKVNFLKGGLVFADSVTTVSPTQAKELRTPGGGFGLHDLFSSLGDRLVGVLNGIDQRIWNPATDTQITAQYSAEKLEGKRRCKAALQRSFGLPQRRRVPLFGMTGRLVHAEGARSHPRRAPSCSAATRSSSSSAAAIRATSTRWWSWPRRRPTGSACSSTSPTAWSTG